MAHQVNIIKGRLWATHRNGQPKHRYTLRWFDPETGRERYESTKAASICEVNLMGNGYIRVVAEAGKTRKHKYGRLQEVLYSAVEECQAESWAFGRFDQELHRQHVAKKPPPHLAAKVKDFAPKRLVGWVQDELKRFCDPYDEQRFMLHDFRKTAITGMRRAGVSPEVMRRHYERLDQRAIAD